MKSKIFFAALALFMAISGFANAQGRHGGRHNGGGYGNNGGGYYNNGNRCNNGGGYNNGNCNNGGYYNGRGNGRCNDGYGRGRNYRRTVSYCQPVVYTAPRYCPPPRRVVIGRPRVNINIGF